MTRGRKRKDKESQSRQSAAPERTPSPRNTQSWMETHGRDLRFLLIFGALMAGYYVVSTTAVVTDRFFPWYLQATAGVSADVLNTLGYDDVTAKGKALDSSKGSIAVERGCDAIAPTALFVSAVLASPAPIASKVPAVFGGIVIRPLRRVGTRSRVTLYHQLRKFLFADLRIATVLERSHKLETADRFSRAVRLRLKIKPRYGTLSVWGEHVRGWDRAQGQAVAFGGDLRVLSGPVRLDLWLTHSRRSGSGARIYAFRPEVWGGRSVISLPADGYAASARLTVSSGPLEITAVTHAAPARRLAIQVGLTR